MLLGTQTINASNHLEIGGCDAVDLAARFGTPLYVMDEAAVRQRCRDYLAAFRSVYPRVEVSFAGKAFLCTGICKIVEQEGLNLDVASGGELYTALAAGFPVERITLHGNNKSREELQMAIEAGIGRIVVDNFYELDLLEDLAPAAPAGPVNVSLRVAPGIDPHTHRLIRTGQVDTKFGFDIGSCASLSAVRRVMQMPQLRLRGLHCHIGSNLPDSEAHCQTVRIMADLLAAAAREGVEVEELNIGGGLGIRYTEDSTPPDLQRFAADVTGSLKEALAAHGLPLPVLLQEPGRYLVGEAGTTLYTLGASKEVPGVRTYVSIDGGLSDNPRPQLYEAKYTALHANRAGSPPDTTVTIAGKHCETDIMIWDLDLPRPQAGDILAVQSTGAYNFSMASNYNRFRRPAVVLAHDGQADLLVERESHEDLIARDRIPPHLV